MNITSVTRRLRNDPSNPELLEQLATLRIERALEYDLLLDDVDKDLILGHSFSKQKNGYIQTCIKVGVGHYAANAGQKGAYAYFKTTAHVIVMSRMLGVDPWDLPKGHEVDHINRDKNDNRRSNLQLLSIELHHDKTRAEIKGLNWTCPQGEAA